MEADYNSGPYKVFKEEMRDTGARVVGCFIPTEVDLYEKSEIHVWLCKNGNIFLTQPWARGGFEIYFPSDEHQTDKTIDQAIAFGTPKG